MCSPYNDFKGLLPGPSQAPTFSPDPINRNGTVFPSPCDSVGRLQRTSIHEGIYPLMTFNKKEKQKHKPSYIRSIASSSYRYKKD